MILEEARLERGEWIKRPGSIENDENGSFMMGNGNCCDISGHVTWSGRRSHCDFTIRINKPVDGIARFEVDCPDRYRYIISGDPLEEHAIVDVSFYKQDFSQQEK